MKKTVLFLFFSLTVFSQKKIESFKSVSLNETRQISITLPPSYEQNTTKEYPLLVLLDGEYLYDPFYGVVSYGSYWDDLPEMIIVSIAQINNKQREEDCGFDPTDGLPTKRATTFFNFISLELLPYIDNEYRTADFKIIAGHDTTAGFLNAFLYKDSPIFNAYISLSPELALDMEIHVPDKLNAIKKPIFYYQASATGDIKQLKEPINELHKSLSKIQNPLLNYKYDEFKASHYSLVPYAIPKALYQIFDIYKPISSSEFTEKIAILEYGHADYLINKYDIIKKTLGLNTTIRINDFKAIEAAILKNKAYNELDKLAEVADKNYPKTMLSSYELGLMFEKKGDQKRAARYYQAASQLEPIGDLTKDMMINKYYDITHQKEEPNGKSEN